MAVGKAKGTFTLDSAILIVPTIGLVGASVTAVIDAVSVDTKHPERDEHVKSPDFLHVDQYPRLRFTSTGVRHFDDDEFVLVGDLTIRDVTRTVELEVEFLGATTDAYGPSVPASLPPPRSAARSSTFPSKPPSAQVMPSSATRSRSPLSWSSPRRAEPPVVQADVGLTLLPVSPGLP